MYPNLPPLFWFIRVIPNPRKTFDDIFGQQNLNYMTQKLNNWKLLLNVNSMIYFLSYNLNFVDQIYGQTFLLVCRITPINRNGGSTQF
jgi:hypothetical protein